MSHTAYARSPCGQYAAAGQGTQVLVWDAVHEHPIVVFGNPYKTAISVVNWSPDGRILLAGSCDGAILAWDIVRKSLLLTGRVPYVFSPLIEVACARQPCIAGLHAGGQVQVWNLRTRELITREFSPGATDLSWLPDGQFLSTNSGDRWHIDSMLIDAT